MAPKSTQTEQIGKDFEMKLRTMLLPMLLFGALFVQGCTQHDTLASAGNPCGRLYYDTFKTNDLIGINVRMTGSTFVPSPHAPPGCTVNVGKVESPGAGIELGKVFIAAAGAVGSYAVLRPPQYNDNSQTHLSTGGNMAMGGNGQGGVGNGGVGGKGGTGGAGGSTTLQPGAVVAKGGTAYGGTGGTAYGGTGGTATANPVIKTTAYGGSANATGGKANSTAISDANAIAKANADADATAKLTTKPNTTTNFSLPAASPPPPPKHSGESWGNGNQVVSPPDMDSGGKWLKKP